MELLYSEHSILDVPSILSQRRLFVLLNNIWEFSKFNEMFNFHQSFHVGYTDILY